MIIALYKSTFTIPYHTVWPSWCRCHSLSLASVKSRLVLPFWYRLTRVVPDKVSLNVCSVHASLTATTTWYYFRLWLLFHLNLGLLVPPWVFLLHNCWRLVKWNLYLPNVVPAIQLSVLKHRSEHKALTVTTDLALFFLHLPMDSRRDVAPFTLVYIHLSVI